MLVTVPPALNPRFSWLAGARLPLPDTVDCTTPWVALAVRVAVLELPEAGPTTNTAATMAPTQSRPSM
jgi:hypothetical protein